MAVCCAVVLSLFAPVMIAGFMEDAAIIAAGTQILRCQLLGIGFNAVILISTCVFQATGNGRATLLTILCRQGFIFVPVLLAVSRMWGFTGVLFAQPLTDLMITALVTALMWKNLREKGIV